MAADVTGPFCSNCGRDRANDAGVTDIPHSACPECVGTNITYRVFAQEVIATAVDSVSLVMRPAPANSAWELRWELLQARLAKITSPHSEELSRDNIYSAERDLFDYFVMAYHLRDLLIADGVITEKPLDTEIKNTYELAVVADLANKDKHKILTRKLKSGMIPEVLEPTGKSNGGKAWDLGIEIVHGEKHLDGLRFAQDVLDAWEKLLKAHGLL